MDRRLGRRQPATATSYLLLLAVMVAIVAGALITRQTTAQAGTVAQPRRGAGAGAGRGQGHGHRGARSLRQRPAAACRVGGRRAGGCSHPAHRRTVFPRPKGLPVASPRHRPSCCEPATDPGKRRLLGSEEEMTRMHAKNSSLRAGLGGPARAAPRLGLSWPPPALSGDGRLSTRSDDHP